MIRVKRCLGRGLLVLMTMIMLCETGTICLAGSNAEVYPIKKAMYGNEKIAMSGVHYTRENSGDLSIKMKKGYILKKIQIGVKKRGQEICYKKIKNNTRISLGEVYKLYSGSAVVKILYISHDSKRKKRIYLHIYKI